MAAFLIKGGKKLEGEIALSGSKNAATKMMIASLLTDEKCILDNFPSIGDTDITREICVIIGKKIHIRENVCEIEAGTIKNTKVAGLSKRNRIPILVLGPLLARAGEAEIPILGGDKIGPRPVDIHLDALRKMGAKISEIESGYAAKAPNGLLGCALNFRYPSVGATENTILAAVLAKGRTIISNSAVEPEIIELIKMLQKMGAIIELGTNRTIYIEGVPKLYGATHKILSDRNEAVSFASLAVASEGKVKVLGAAQDHLITFLNALRRIGGKYAIEDDGITFFGNGKLNFAEIETDTHPGYMTDWQQPFAVLLTQADGVSAVHETVYEDRFGYTNELNAMGANIKLFTKCLGNLSCRFLDQNNYHSAIIEGPTKLHGIELNVRDLRAGIAHIIAAIIAEGESKICGIEEIDRGYENIDIRLRAIGADIKRV